MTKKIAILVIILFSIFNNTLSTPSENCLQLRIFPELRGKKISEISVIDSNNAIAVGRETLFKWSGDNWQHFTPPFPRDRIHVDYLKAFSLKNIWLFVHITENYYRSLIYHFNGTAWNHIPSPQPYDLSSAAFIDSASFYATGQYGNLIHLNGVTAKNLPNPGGRSAQFAAYFNPSHFLIWTKEDNSASQSLLRLNEFNHGIWQHKDTVRIKTLICNSLFISPDSGYFTNRGNFLYKYAKNQFTLLDSFPSLPSGPYQNGKLYYYCTENSILWSYNIFTQKREKIALIPLDCSTVPLAKNEFLLLGNDQNVYYLGKQKFGEPFKQQRLVFRQYSLSKQPPSNHYSVSSYRNKNNVIDLYFTNIYDKNSFFVFTFDSSPVGIVLQDTLQDRGLVGLDKKKYPEDSLDHGCFFADIDNDGDSDAIVVSIRGPSLLYENVGDDRFEDITDEMHFDLSGRIGSICWSDLNDDGLLDIVAGDYCGPIYILLNQGHFRFKEIAYKTGIPYTLKNRFVALADVDNDGDHDLFFFNNSESIRYFENKGIQDSTKLPHFVDASYRSPQLTTRFDFFTQAMAFGDYDNDGDLHLFLANRRSPLKLFQNDGHGNFADVSEFTGFDQRVLAFGANWGDLDQDGYLDIFLTTLGKNYIFWNNGGKFFEMDSTFVPTNDLASSTGSVLEDLDADGDLDIAVARSEISYSQIYRSKLDRQNFIKLQLQGTRSNCNGIGGCIWLYESGHKDDPRYLRGYRQITTNTGYCSSRLPQAYFGVDAEKKYDVVVEFPNGQRVEKLNLIPGGRYTICENASIVFRIGKKISNLKIFMYRPKYRNKALRSVLFLLIMVLFNFYIYSRKYWPGSRMLFFSAILFSIYIPMATLIKSNQMDFWWFLPIYVILILGVPLFILIQHYTAIQYKNEHLGELYDNIRKLHHSKEGMKQITHLDLYLNNIHQLTLNEKIKEDIQQDLKSFSYHTVPMIRQLLNEGKRLGLPLSQVRQIEKNLKSCRSMVKLLSTPKPADKKIQSFSLSLKRLKSQVAGLRKSVEKLFVCDLFEVLNDSLAKFPKFTEVVILNPEGQKSLQVIILPEELAQVFSNLFENSLRAMENMKDKRIRITIEPSLGEKVTVKIKDYGEGISPDRQSLIFEESFSSKGSTGLGLFHARQLLQRYGGNVELLQSVPGEGAVFQLKLRTEK